MAAVGAGGTGVRRLPHLGAHRQHPGQPSRASARGNESDVFFSRTLGNIFFTHLIFRPFYRHFRNIRNRNFSFGFALIFLVIRIF